MTLKQIAREAGLPLGTIQNLTAGKTRWAEPATRSAVAAFLGWPLLQVEKCLQAASTRPVGRIDRCQDCGREVWRQRSGKRPRICRECLDKRHRVEVSCAECGAALKIAKSRAARSRHHFCSTEHHDLWRAGRSKPPNLPRSGYRSGRHLLRVRLLTDEPSVASIARQAGVNPSSLWRCKRGGGRPIIRYRLEKAGLLRTEARPPLAEAILDFCVRENMCPGDLWRRAGIGQTTMYRLLKRGYAKVGTLARLGAAMGEAPEKLASLCLPFRVGRKPARPGPGRPPTFTHADELRVRQLVDEEGLSLAEAGRRMGWRIKKRTCPMAKRAYERAHQGLSHCPAPHN
jgi:hypothetical protein